MAQYQTHSTNLDKNTTRQRPPFFNPSKDHRCHDRYVSEPPTSPRAREPCAHKEEFAPTPNRFSILAEVDQRDNQAKFAFDFVQTSKTEVRRRGKRGGRHIRLKNAKKQQYEGQTSESEGVEELCREMSTICIDSERSRAAFFQDPNTTKQELPRCDFTFSANGVRNPWAPRERPTLQDATSTSAATIARPVSNVKVNIPGPSKRCWTKPTPSSYGLADFKRKESRFFPMSAFPTTPDAPTRLPDLSTLPLSTPARTSAPKKQLPIAIPTIAQKAAVSAACRALAIQKAISSPMTPSSGQRSPSSTNSPFALFPFTPWPTSPPTLTTPPSVSSVPSLVSAPSVISSPGTISSQPIRTPPPLPPRPHLAPSTSSIKSWTSDVPSPTSPLSLLSLPNSTPPRPTLTRDSAVQPRPVFTQPITPAVPILRKPKPPVRVSSAIRNDLEAFLKMGHASPCWCNAHSDPTSPSSVQAQPATPVQQEPDQQESEPDQLLIPRKRTFSDSDLESVVLTPSPLGSDFEDLFARHDYEHVDEEWTVVTPKEEEDEKEESLIASIDSPASEGKRDSDVASTMSWPTSPLTPISPASPPTAAEPGPATEIKKHEPLTSSSPWATPTSSPTTHKPDYRSNANASVVEWPTLQESVKVKRLRRGRHSTFTSGNSAGESGKSTTNEEVDWVV